MNPKWNPKWIDCPRQTCTDSHPKILIPNHKMATPTLILIGIVNEETTEEVQQRWSDYHGSIFGERHLMIGTWEQLKDKISTRVTRVVIPIEEKLVAAGIESLESTPVIRARLLELISRFRHTHQQLHLVRGDYSRTSRSISSDPIRSILFGSALSTEVRSADTCRSLYLQRF